MPDKAGFKDIGEIVATIFHPYMHVAGAEDRLERLAAKVALLKSVIDKPGDPLLQTNGPQLLAEMKDICDAQLMAISAQPPQPPRPGIVS